ncbi:MAG TPA: MFS transporter [Caulobacteraceae bacterium]|nr:MFS transporter [Caulobacteraceae bacterium]
MSSTTATAAAPDRISWPRLFAFALPGLPIGGLAVALSVYLPRFYASHIGLSLAAVGAAFGAIRLIDMFFDPFIGVAMDHTRTRLGRYRVWLLAAIPLLGIPVYMLFLAPAGVPLAYLVGWLFVYYIGTSVVALSHASWASVVASNYHDRSRVFGTIQVVSTVAATAILVVALLLSKSSVAAVQVMGWFVVIVTPLGILMASAFTPERIVVEHSAEKVTARDYWEMITWPEMLRIVAAAFCLTMGPGWMSAMYLFYFHDSRGFSFQASTVLLAFYIVAGVVGAGGLSWLATRIGKHRTLMAASTGYSLGLILIALMPKGNFAIAAILMITLGFLAAGFVLLGRAMCADVGDAIRLKKGKHRQGLLYSLMTSVEKIAGALAIFVSFNVLAAVGYQAKEGARNTPGAIHNLELVYVLGPIFFVMLGGACYLGYKLDHKRHAEIRSQLDAREAGVIEPGAVLETFGGDVVIPPAPAE